MNFKNCKKAGSLPAAFLSIVSVSVCLGCRVIDEGCCSCCSVTSARLTSGFILSHSQILYCPTRRTPKDSVISQFHACVTTQKEVLCERKIKEVVTYSQR